MKTKIPTAFITRRLQSLSGCFLVLFLLEHLLTNSQAALFFGQDRALFITAVNVIYSLPYLPAIECLLLGMPILIHGYFGIQYLRTAQYNSGPSDGSTPSLPLPRNKAYTWQRITSVLLVIGIFLHVLTMRFIHHPEKIHLGGRDAFTVSLTKDDNLPSVARELNIQLLDTPAKSPQDPNQTVAIAPSFGAAIFMVVRSTFQSPWMCLLYSLFVCAACFHSCNGLWTFAITWGITLSEKSRRRCRFFANTVMMTLIALGLISIWGSR